jgi:hypothetical protein
VFGLYRLNSLKISTLRTLNKFGLYRILVFSGFGGDTVTKATVTAGLTTSSSYNYENLSYKNWSTSTLADPNPNTFVVISAW